MRKVSWCLQYIFLFLVSRKKAGNEEANVSKCMCSLEPVEGESGHCIAPDFAHVRARAGFSGPRGLPSGPENLLFVLCSARPGPI